MSTSIEPLSKTLSEQLALGRLTAPEVLRHAQALGEALRKLHQKGVVHGAITPSAIRLGENGLELAGVAGEQQITAYTAPEVLAGREVDATSDIFSFGVVLYEMLTGRRPFDGSNQTELVAAIVGKQPAPTGNPVADRLMEMCLAKDPAERCRRIQRVLIELRGLASNGRAKRSGRSSKGESHAEPKVSNRRPSARDDIQHLETRLSARMTNFEDRISELVRTAGESLAVMRAQLAAATDGLTAPRAQQFAFRESAERALALIQASVNAAVERIGQLEQAVSKSAERLQAVEEGVAATRKRLNDLHSAMADDFINFEEKLKEHSSAIESAWTAIGQTDDLVERVVDMIENLRSGEAMDRPEGLMAIVN